MTDSTEATPTPQDPADAGCGGHGRDDGGGCGGCGCGGHGGVPELDARIIDPTIRQSAIFGVLMGLPPQGRVRIVAPHDPSPIADLLAERLPGEYGVEVDQVGADEWRATFSRITADASLG